MAAERRRAAFIDRDGVINEDLGHVHRIQDFHFLPDVADGLLTLQRAGYALIVVTNQAGIAKGMYREADFEIVTGHMRQALAVAGVGITAVYFCPHHPQGSVPSLSIVCGCRKPAPGMLLKAASDHGLDLPASVLIGDKASDVDAGRAAGVGRNVLVRSGHVLSPDSVGRADRVCDDLVAAARFICAERDPPAAGPLHPID